MHWRLRSEGVAEPGGLLAGVELADDHVPGGGGADRLGAAVTRRCLELGLPMVWVTLALSVT